MKRQIASTILIGMLLFSTSVGAQALNATYRSIDSNQFSLAIKEDGSLMVWGGDMYAWSGAYRRSPEKMMDDVVYVATGSAHRFFIKSDGSLWGWGLNTVGQIGDGTSSGDFIPGTLTPNQGNNRPEPVKIMDDVSSVAAGRHHSLAVKKDGSLWTWGSNAYGALGDDRHQLDDRNPAKIMDDVVFVAATDWRSFAIKTDGSLWAWGNNQVFTPTWPFNTTGALGDGTNVDRHAPVKIMDDVVYISASPTHSFAIKNDQSLWAWGDNEFGQLGDGTTEDREAPVKVMDNVAHVAAGLGHSLVVKTDGSLWTWGRNESGQLGDGTVSTRQMPVKIMDNVVYVAVGLRCSFAVKTDGSLWAWGSNTGFQLGDGTRANSSFPIKILDGMKLPYDMLAEAPLPGQPLDVIRVIYNWNTLFFDQPPIIEDGRVLVPLRVIFEALRADVDWNHETQTVTAENNGVMIVMQIGNPLMTIDGESVALDVPPQIVNGRTLVPVRAVAEAFDAEVTWDGANRVVTILKDFF